MIDTHAHLDPLDAGEVLARARAAGVTRVITVGTTLEGCREALELAHTNDGVVASLGIHPHEASGPDAAGLDELEELLADERAVAVGETGLDYFRDYADRGDQRRLFEGHVRLAGELGLPLVIHTREADADTLAVLAGFSGTVVLHCFSSPALLSPALERGYYLSFAGNVTYPNAAALREAAGDVPAERLLAETDSPYLAPVPRRGARNEPAFVMQTLAALAALRGQTPEALAALIMANATRAFGL